MKGVYLFVFAVSLQLCSSRSLEEDSVVSVYTTLPTTSGTHPNLDVYHEIASNIAERITSPIYRFLGIGKNKTIDDKNTTQTWDKIEILDDGAEETTKPNYVPVDNNIDNKETEELSVEALRKSDRRPEKITLYSSYLPVKENVEVFNVNDTINEVDSKPNDTDDDEFTLDDIDEDEDEDPPEGFISYVISLLGGIARLIWGGLVALVQRTAYSYNSN